MVRETATVKPRGLWDARLELPCGGWASFAAVVEARDREPTRRSSPPAPPPPPAPVLAPGARPEGKVPPAELLQRAALLGLRDPLRPLLEAGADPNAKFDAYGRPREPPLAVERGDRVAGGMRGEGDALLC